MAQQFEAGDFLVFQLEAGFALLRLLGTDEMDGRKILHLAAYADFFPSVESAEVAALGSKLTLSRDHIALTERAFESTQVSRIANVPLIETDLAPLNEWRAQPGTVYERSVRLVLGLR